MWNVQRVENERRWTGWILKTDGWAGQEVGGNKTEIPRLLSIYVIKIY